MKLSKRVRAAMLYRRDQPEFKRPTPTAEERKAENRARRKANRKRLRRMAKVIARIAMDLADKPKQREVESWLKRWKEWRRNIDDSRRRFEIGQPQPKPPREWCWGLLPKKLLEKRR